MRFRWIPGAGAAALLLAGAVMLAACGGAKSEPAETSAAAESMSAAAVEAETGTEEVIDDVPEYDTEIRGRIARFLDGTVMLINESSGPIVLSGDVGLDALETGDDVSIGCTGIEETYPAQTTVVQLMVHEKGSAADLPADVIDSLADMNYILADGGAGPKEEEEIMGSSYLSISMEELKSRLTEEEGFILLDVRRLDEYEAGHLPGAINVANEDIDKEPPEDLPDLDQRIYVYCRSGKRSKQAAQKLTDMGYTDIVECGGIIDWTGEIE